MGVEYVRNDDTPRFSSRDGFTTERFRGGSAETGGSGKDGMLAAPDSTDKREESSRTSTRRRMASRRPVTAQNGGGEVSHAEALSSVRAFLDGLGWLEDALAVAERLERDLPKLREEYDALSRKARDLRTEVADLEKRRKSLVESIAFPERQ
jgi:hypothetical protein